MHDTNSSRSDKLYQCHTPISFTSASIPPTRSAKARSKQTKSQHWRGRRTCRLWRSPTPPICSAPWSSARPVWRRGCSRSSAVRWDSRERAIPGCPRPAGVARTGRDGVRQPSAAFLARVPGYRPGVEAAASTRDDCCPCRGLILLTGGASGPLGRLLAKGSVPRPNGC